MSVWGVWSRDGPHEADGAQEHGAADGDEGVGGGECRGRGGEAGEGGEGREDGETEKAEKGKRSKVKKAEK